MGRYFSGTSRLLERLLDIGDGRIRDMDAAGIDMQILSLTAPGVQVFDAATARRTAVHALPDRLHVSERAPQTDQEPSDYMRRNVYITSSGLAYAPAIALAQRELGLDRVLYAMDYPYQYDIDEVHYSDDFPLSAAEKKMFFQTNAGQVFRMSAHS